VTGTGLGLVIVRSLVDLHGGDLHVTSVPGEGTTITFTLPVVSGEELPAIHAPAASAGGRVLVVDDEPDIAQLFARYLERAGYRVQLAASATEALRLARAEQPDLIILDLVLPKTDGFTALEWLKLDPSTAAIPVLLLSILEDDGRGRLLGAVDYLTKPVQEPTLLAHVATALAGAQPSPAR
jgi:CheY-like chemotaxis protein